MIRYQPGLTEDMELLAWWLHLGETGDLDRAFNRGACVLSVFTRLFDEPTELWFARDAKGWYAAAWLTPLMSGVTFSLWIREDHRKSRDSVTFIHEVIQHAIAHWPVVIYVTRDDAVVRQGERFGFTKLGDVPYLFDGDTATVGVATAFSYEAATQPQNRFHEDTHESAKKAG